MGGNVVLRRVDPADVPTKSADPVDDATLAQAGAIVNAVKEGGEKALLELSVKFGDLKSTSEPYIWDKHKLKAAYDGISKDQQDLLQRTAARIKTFALAQRASVKEVTVNVPGGRCGQTIAPVECAGCYAPGGRYPLPSSVLMTASTAFAAGVKQVVLASPKPSPMTAAAAYVAGVDFLVVVGGAQAIAAMAFGVGKVPPCDVIVGPGNRFVMAAKKLVSGRVAIDMLAGPSELLVLADHTANAATVAADLLAQAEHDTLALPLLVTTDESFVAKVEAELTKQLAVLPTAAVASVSLASGYVVVCKDMDTAIDITNRLAPEHLEVITANEDEVAAKLQHYGGIFIGSHAAEVLGDYGAGPNHTLPTGGTARYTGGLSVFNFLRIRTWLKIDHPEMASELVEDSIALAELEGLIGHSRSARCRRLNSPETFFMVESETTPKPVVMRRVSPADVPTTNADPVDDATLAQAGAIVNAIKDRGEAALLELSVKFGDLKSTSEPYIWDKHKLKACYDGLPKDQQDLLQRTAARIKAFALAQRASVTEVTVNVPGGRCGQTIAPVETAGCYAPGGRYPLPSSVLMTASTAFAAGVKQVVLASPKPSPVTAAAAYVAGVDFLVTVGGAQAIAAMAFGVGKVPACDVICGPGNRFVTAAKKLVSGRVAIDMLAGPSELLVLADHTANAATVAADLLAQAEHDTLALPLLVTTDESFVAKVEAELTKQLAVLPTAAVASVSLASGYVVVCKDMEEAIDITNRLAPEHLEVITADEDEVAAKLQHYGGLFIGANAAEVLGDYGAGPNHTLPTSGTARYTGGLSVFNFLRIRTWLKIDKPVLASELVEDSIQLAELEGLIGHSRSAQHRRLSSTQMADPLRLIRPDFQMMMKYSPVQPLDVLAAEIGMPKEELSKLDANENLYGPLPEIIGEISKAVLHIYPDPAQTSLREAVGRFTGYTKEWCLCGAGSDELLDIVTRVMDPEKILVASPTFAMYRFFALLQKTAIVDVLRGPAPEFALDVDEMIKEIRNGCKLVFIASPNNPTGNCTTNDIVRRLCAEECIVVMDEAYAEFADEHCLPLVAEYPNLMVMRTFSKWAGLAGVRCGFVVAHPSLVNAMMQIKQPYNISVAADIAATYSLDHSDRVFVAVRAMRYERYRMMSQLNSFSFLTPLPSDANFLLVDTGCVDSREIQAALRAKGVLVRCYAGGSSKALEPFIRISCGRPQDTDKLMQVLKDLDPTPAKSGKISILSEMGAPKCVLWDMDGVLAEVGSSYRLAIIRTAAHFGVTLSDDDIRKAKNLGNANNDWVLTQRLVNAVKGAGSVTLEAVTDHFQSLYVGVGGGPGLRDSEMLIPTKAFLTAAARKYPMAVVTGRPRDECMHFLATHGLTDLFKVFVCMEDGPAKPSPAPVLSALKQLGLQHTEGFSYMIGDTVDDVKAALAANCNVVGLGFLPPSESTPFTAKCDIVAALYEAGCARVLYDMRQLEEILLGTPFEIYDAPSALTPAPPKALAAPHHAVSASAPAALAPTGRYSKISRKTSETFVEVELWIDGTGQSKINTGLGFLDHMITALSKHSRFDLNITCKGDTWIDDHHTTEDVALTLGACLLEAMGDKRGITRFGNAYCPLDEALCRAVIDISGRPHSEVSLDLKRDMVGQVSSEMLAHFLRSLATEARITLHVDVLKGINDHHKAECAYKATAVALRLALARTAINDVPSTKGCL